MAKAPRMILINIGKGKKFTELKPGDIVELSFSALRKRRMKYRVAGKNPTDFMWLQKVEK